jgi:hypothetical protein
MMKDGFVSSPSDNDVICGRRCRKDKLHIGNERFQCIIQSRLAEYHLATKNQRSDIISDVVNKIENGSINGFLQFDSTSKHYYRVDNYKAVSNFF